MLNAGVRRLSTDFDAMVVANQATNFSAGANLMLLLISAQEEEWDEWISPVRQFQNINLALKYASRSGGRGAARTRDWRRAVKCACTPREFTLRRRRTSAWWKPASD